MILTLTYSNERIYPNSPYEDILHNHFYTKYKKILAFLWLKLDFDSSYILDFCNKLSWKITTELYQNSFIPIIIMQSISSVAVAPVPSPRVGTPVLTQRRGLGTLVDVHTHLVVRRCILETFWTFTPVGSYCVHATSVVWAGLESKQA